MEAESDISRSCSHLRTPQDVHTAAITDNMWKTQGCDLYLGLWVLQMRTGMQMWMQNVTFGFRNTPSNATTRPLKPSKCTLLYTLQMHQSTLHENTAVHPSKATTPPSKNPPRAHCYTPFKCHHSPPKPSKSTLLYAFKCHHFTHHLLLKQNQVNSKHVA